MDIKRNGKQFHVITDKAHYDADIVINAAGLGSAKIMNMIEDTSLFDITPKRGQYFILSKHATDFVKHVLYPVPGKAGKGVLCVPTCHGNILLGPNSEILEEQDNGTSAQGLKEVREKLQKTVIFHMEKLYTAMQDFDHVAIIMISLFRHLRYLKILFTWDVSIHQVLPVHLPSVLMSLNN